jgi:hypothetical protein
MSITHRIEYYVHPAITARIQRALRKLSSHDLLRVAGAEYVRRAEAPNRLKPNDRVLWDMVLTSLDREVQRRAAESADIDRALTAPTQSHAVSVDELAQLFRSFVGAR